MIRPGGMKQLEDSSEMSKHVSSHRFRRTAGSQSHLARRAPIPFEEGSIRVIDACGSTFGFEGLSGVILNGPFRATVISAWQRCQARHQQNEVADQGN